MVLGGDNRVSIYAIETIGLTKKFGEQLGVNDLGLHVPQGKIYGL